MMILVELKEIIEVEEQKLVQVQMYTWKQPVVRNNETFEQTEDCKMKKKNEVWAQT